jgi:microcin C transport system permease protein
MKSFKIHPITRQRLQRFRKVGYAYRSLLLLLILYGFSLCAELLCNDRPLLLRYDGKTYVPFLKYYPEDTFTGSGRMTRADYKEIAKTPGFAGNRENFMLFAPIPFGPKETLKPQDIETTKHVTVEFEAQPSIAVLYLNPDLSVNKLRDAAASTGIQAGDLLSAHVDLSSKMQAAFTKRFDGREDAVYQEAVELGGKRFNLKLAENKAGEARSTARAYLNEVLLPLEPMDWLDGGWNSTSADWNAVPPDVRALIETRAQQATTDSVYNLSVTLNGTPYKINFSTEQVIFPFRPCKGHYLGLDSAGRDVLVLIVYGMRIAFSFGIVLVLTSMVLGTLVGAIQGYYAGKVDMIGQRLIEIWESIPFL